MAKKAQSRAPSSLISRGDDPPHPPMCGAARLTTSTGTPDGKAARYKTIIQNELWSLPMADDTGDEACVQGSAPASGKPKQLRPTDVKPLNREWRRPPEGRPPPPPDSVRQP